MVPNPVPGARLLGSYLPWKILLARWVRAVVYDKSAWVNCLHLRSISKMQIIQRFLAVSTDRNPDN